MKHFTKLLSTLKEKQMQEGYSKCRDKPVRKKKLSRSLQEQIGEQQGGLIQDTLDNTRNFNFLRCYR